VQVTRDGGKSWTNTTPNIPGVPKGLWVSRVQASNHDPARAYAAIDGHRSDDFHAYLFTTDDFGATWRSIAGALDAPMKGFREDPVNPNLLFAGTEFGIFMSLDRGATWQPLKEGLPTVSVDDIQIHPRDHDLLIGTHGRSIYVIDDISALEQLTRDKLSQNALFTPRPATEFYYTPIGGLWGAHVFKAKNPPFGATINYYLAGVPRDNVTITIENSKGQTVRELDGANRPGLNRVIWDLRPDPREAIGDQRGADAQVPYVAAGEYTVRMKYGDFKSSTKLTVEAEPGVHAGEFVSPQ